MAGIHHNKYGQVCYKGTPIEKWVGIHNTTYYLEALPTKPSDRHMVIGDIVFVGTREMHVVVDGDKFNWIKSF